jgi:hypothetical protein
MGVHGDAADSAPVSRSRSPSFATNEPLELFLGRERFLLPFSDVFSKTSERIGRDRKESGRGRRQLTSAEGARWRQLRGGSDAHVCQQTASGGP